MSRPPHVMIAALVLATTLSACGQGMPSQAARKAPGMSAAREAADEAALIRGLALEAHDALLKLDAAYHDLGLDTAAGRKLTPKREPIVRDGLKPVLARLEGVTTSIAQRLTVDQGSAKLATLRDAFSGRAPFPGDMVAADADANAMLYRVAQYRLKLGFLVEYALRRGLVADLPAPPADKPKPGPNQDPGGVEE